MNSIIKINARILDEIVKHSLINTNLECGGFLFGNYQTNYGNQIINIDAIYYERLFGTENRFAFYPSYEYRALCFGKNIKSNYIGCYHSHASYPAIFSKEDRKLELYYASNKVALIYSPSENRLVGDIITRNNIYEAKTTVVNPNEEDRLFYPSLTNKPGKTISIK